MRFDTEITLTGPWRSPAQMLEEQNADAGGTVHDEATAAKLGLRGAPIEAPTHFSQFDPLAVQAWGPAWFEHGCISAHFRTMVVEGEQVQASLALDAGGRSGRIDATKNDGSPVLTGSASIGPDHPRSFLDDGLASMGDPGELHIIDQMVVGSTLRQPEHQRLTRDERNGSGYPFSLDEKLERITEPHPWYTEAGASSSPWGRAIVPFEMISVLSAKHGPRWPVRQPSLGLFLDLEIRLLDGPVFVDQDYLLDRELVALSQSRRTESYWTRTTIRDAADERVVASVLLHAGVFKDSYPGYPTAAAT